jgi:hypothetical protein
MTRSNESYLVGGLMVLSNPGLDLNITLFKYNAVYITFGIQIFFGR